MFGTLRLPKGDLSPELREDYQGHFCAVCHSLDSWGGKLSSLLTNYDVTFWLLVLTSLEPTLPAHRRCTAVPFRQVPVMQLRPESRKLVAALTLALAGAKVEDDQHDGDRPWVRWAFMPLRPGWSRARRYLADCGFPLDAVEGLGPWQRALESRADSSLEELTLPTQNLLAAAFGFLADHTRQPEHRQALEELGRGLGSFIYLWDAWQDRARDGARGSFNPLLRTSSPPERLAFLLSHSLSHVQSALNRLPLRERRPLLDNQIGRLRALLRQELPAPNRSSRLACWILGGAAALALQPQASVACDGVDCNGCDGVDCSGCDGCSCDGCHGCDCNGCDSCGHGCHGCDCGHGCTHCGDSSCGGDCCSGINCSADCCDAAWNCGPCPGDSHTSCDICCCDFGGGSKKPKKVQTPEAPPEDEDEIPGVKRDASTPWKKPVPKPAEETTPDLDPPDPESQVETK